jgi:hypothetical protein
VEVTAWRGGLWAGALAKQGVADAVALGAELQAGRNFIGDTAFYFIFRLRSRRGP